MGVEEGLSYGLFPELGFEEIKAWNSTGETTTPLYPTSYKEAANPTSNLAGKRILPPRPPHVCHVSKGQGGIFVCWLFTRSRGASASIISICAFYH